MRGDIERALFPGSRQAGKMANVEALRRYGKALGLEVKASRRRWSTTAIGAGAGP